MITSTEQQVRVRGNVDVYFSVTGSVITASTNRRGGRLAPTAGKADWIVEQLTSVGR